MDDGHTGWEREHLDDLADSAGTFEVLPALPPDIDAAMFWQAIAEHYRAQAEHWHARSCDLTELLARLRRD